MTKALNHEGIKYLKARDERLDAIVKERRTYETIDCYNASIIWCHSNAWRCSNLKIPMF